ncbi:hypothetical protein H0H93_002168, partial [Arthromyces matolae]
MSKRKRSAKPQVERYYDEDITDDTLAHPTIHLTRHLEVEPTRTGLSTRRIIFEHSVDPSDVRPPAPSTQYKWNTHLPPNASADDGDGSFSFNDLNPDLSGA